jgi:ABC-type Fe3+/spermidine/putrescine transport system ATPase subunit
MNQGRAEQVGRPREIYNTPCNHFVASFIGASNFFDGVVEESVSDDAWLVRTPFALFAVQTEASIQSGDRVVVSVRPENVGIRDAAGDEFALNECAGVVTRRAFLGESVDHQVSIEGSAPIMVRCNPSTTFAPQTPVVLTFPKAWCTLLPG